MYGWKARLGAIIVSANTVVEPDLYRVLPEGVSLHFSRACMRGDEPAVRYQCMLDAVPRCTDELMLAGVDAIAFVCTGGSMYRGAGADDEIVAEIEARAGRPATTTSIAVVEGLRALGVERVAVGTPYGAWTNEREREYLVQRGFEVVAMEGLNCPSADDMARVGSEGAYELACRVNAPNADGIFLSCTNLRSLEVIERIEAATGKPTVCSNQATLWKLLRLAGLTGLISGCGALFDLSRQAA